MFKENKKTLPIWNEVKEYTFPGSDGTFEEVIGSVDSYLQICGCDVVNTVLDCGEHYEFFPGKSKSCLEDVMCDASSTVDILRNLIYLSPVDISKAIGGKWLVEPIDKGYFSRFWEFHVIQAIKQVQGLYERGVRV